MDNAHPTPKALGWTWKVARDWSRGWRFHVGLPVLVAVIPFLAFVAVGRQEGTLWLPNVDGVHNNGLFEDPIFLAYFPVAWLLLYSARHIVRSARDLRKALPFVVRHDGRSTLTEARFKEMGDYYDVLLARMALQKVPPQGKAPDSCKGLSLAVRVLVPLTFAVAGLFLALSTYQHWNAQQAYGFDIWASSHHLLGFCLRLAFETVLYPFMAIVVSQLLVAICIMQHALRTLRSHDAIRYVRFAHDRAGGFAEFGEHSLMHVVAMLPFLLLILAYVVFYPSTGILWVGLVVYLVGLPLIFFLPLAGARRAMGQARRNELEMVGGAVGKHYDQLKASLGKDDLAAVEREAGLVSEGEKVFQAVADQSCWPFSTSLLARFGSITAGLWGIALPNILAMLGWVG
ncbi:MAG: hypothetical protein QOD77_222 [Thermoplasmata archaeon]|jgi:hypothetical protein|nr:hypothetical protein [Thermoplasmata archaeon]